MHPSNITHTMVIYYHEKVFHSGRNATVNKIRSNGLLIINLCSVVKFVIWKCVMCRRLREKFGFQKMSDLPIERTLDS